VVLAEAPNPFPVVVDDDGVLLREHLRRLVVPELGTILDRLQ
jgi:hypothetical protein